MDTAGSSSSQTSEKVGKSKALEVGPWGGNGGSSWDDGSFSGVRKITLFYGLCIDSIRVEYDKNGTIITAEKHGGNGGIYTAKIKLRYPKEFLTSISGHCGPLLRGGNTHIRSLTFKSNRRTFGPYGVEEGTPFIFNMDGDQIVGFKGRSAFFLDAIGFRISHRQAGCICQLM